MKAGFMITDHYESEQFHQTSQVQKHGQTFVIGWSGCLILMLLYWKQNIIFLHGCGINIAHIYKCQKVMLWISFFWMNEPFNPSYNNLIVFAFRLFRDRDRTETCMRFHTLHQLSECFRSALHHKYRRLCKMCYIMLDKRMISVIQRERSDSSLRIVGSVVLQLSFVLVLKWRWNHTDF